MQSLQQQTQALLDRVFFYFFCFDLYLLNTEHCIVLEQETQAFIDQIVTYCERLELLAAKEPAGQRSHTKQQVNQLRYDNKHLQAALRQVQHRRHTLESEDRERKALLATDFLSNSAGTGTGGGSGADGSTSVYIDQEISHHNRLAGSHRRMDDLLASGSGVLTSIQQQGDLLKSTRKRVLDVLNVLGLSNAAMGLIERRSAQDKIIFWIGVVFTCVIIFMFWKFVT